MTQAQPSGVPFGEWVYPRYWAIHRSIRSLPRLESDISELVEAFARSPITSSNAKLQYNYLIAAIAAVRGEQQRAFRALSDLRRGLNRSRFSDADLERHLATIYADVPEQEELLAKLRSAGGMNAFLKRASLFLLARYEAYSECLRRVRSVSPESPDDFARVTEELWEILPGGPGTPDLQYKWFCSGGPWGWAVTAIIIIIPIVLDGDGGGDDDPPEDGGSEGGDPEEDACYPGDGLDFSQGTCGPA